MNRDNLDLLKEFKSVKEKRLAKELAFIKDGIKRKEMEVKMLLDKREEIIYIHNQKSLMNPSELELFFCQMLYLDEEIKKIKEDLLKMRKEYEEKLNELVDASKERRLVEKLIERINRTEQYEILRKEQKFLDEVSNIRFWYVGYKNI